MKKIILLAMSISVLISGCLNIAPDEKWDDDDTSIWISYASGLNLESHWFNEQARNRDSTILGYEQEFESQILDQITKSPHFNETSPLSAKSLLDELIGESLKGMWYKDKQLFRFIQVPGNQYPLTMKVDSAENKIKIESTRMVQ